MPSSNNLAVLAAAGSRKTQHIVECVLGDPGQRALVTTYTTENMNQLVDRLTSGGAVPRLVTTMPWFTFLLSQCARPYQSAVLGDVGVIRGLNFLGQPNRFIPKSKPRAYYLDRDGDLYRDRTAAFACEANRLSAGQVIGRLAEIYDHVYIDEVQDLAGDDLTLVKLLMDSPIAVTMVGDPRQATFSTNNAAKNKRYKGSAIAEWLWNNSASCDIEHRSESFRCNQAICDFADGLYSDQPSTTSKNTEITGHDGIFAIRPDEVRAYVEEYSPTVLRWDKRANTQGLAAMNFGQSKGSTFDRVLIFPTQPMVKYYRTRKPEQAGDRAKLYVAVTRAKHSVAFVIP